MEAQTIRNPRRAPAGRPMELVLVRANAPLFFSVGCASLLESAATRHASRMLRLFSHDAQFCDWLKSQWLPAKLTRARKLRDYVETAWPEFDWAAAAEHHRASVAGSGGPACSPDATHEALGRCIAAAQSVLYYRALARWGDDRRLRELAATIASEETHAFAQFRAAFERASRAKRIGFTAAWRTALACVRTARDTHVRLAFEALAAQWSGRAPFPRLDYSEFVRRMRAVVIRGAELNMIERVVFRAWRHAPQGGFQPTPSFGAGWFKAVLANPA
jgi:hypothetical protein